MDGAPRGLVVFQMMFQTYLVCKFLHCCIYNIRSWLCLGIQDLFLLWLTLVLELPWFSVQWVWWVAHVAVVLAGIMHLRAMHTPAAFTYPLLHLAVNMLLHISVFEVWNFLMHCILSFIAHFWMQEKVRYIALVISRCRVRWLSCGICLHRLLAYNCVCARGRVHSAGKWREHVCMQHCFTVSKNMGLCSYRSTSILFHLISLLHIVQ